MWKAIFLCGLIGLTGIARAADPGEHLYVDVGTKLPGWSVTPVPDVNGVEITVLVPPGQTPKAWTDQVAVETFAGPPRGTAAELLVQRFGEIARACEDTTMGPMSPVTENGYDTAMRAVACTKIKGRDQGEVSLYKAWIGKDRMYLVARAWRGPAFDKEHVPVKPEVTLQWLAFVQSIVLCDTRDPHRPCPQAGAAKKP
jgi:hypothetical protein